MHNREVIPQISSWDLWYDVLLFHDNRYGMGPERQNGRWSEGGVSEEGKGKGVEELGGLVKNGPLGRFRLNPQAP